MDETSYDLRPYEEYPTQPGLNYSENYHRTNPYQSATKKFKNYSGENYKVLKNRKNVFDLLHNNRERDLAILREQAKKLNDTEK
jgi:hypothetical protein